MSSYLFIFMIFVASVSSITKQKHASGQTCLEEDIKLSTSIDCAWSCVEALYENIECESCSLKGNFGSNATWSVDIDDRLSRLMEVDYLRTNDENIPIVATCRDCGVAIIGVKSFRRPNDLYEFFNKTKQFSDTAAKQPTNETIEAIHQLYTDISRRSNETTKWCLDFIGVNKQMKNLNIVPAIDGSTEKTTVITGTADAVETDSKNAADMTTINFNVTTANKTESSTKNSNKQKVTKCEHHYPVSVSMILVMLAVLMSVFASFGVILRLYFGHQNGQKQQQQRQSSDSTNHLFGSKDG